jgi:phosphatidylglycerol:prolipoprotein diacylglycerol transferase
VPLAFLTLTFDPVLHLGDTLSIRYETVALVVVILGGLVLAARIGSQTPAFGPFVPAPGLRIDDLVFIVIGAVPGAIIGGRIGYVLDHLAYYQAHPEAILDPTQGGLTLSLAVPLGIVTGSLIARLLGAPVVRWMHAFALPLLFVLAAGKAVEVLGATGQGRVADLAWSTAYAGPGPWGSLAPAVPSHPAQLYEAILVGLAIVVFAVVSRFEVIARRDGAALYAALGLWAIARCVVVYTWRDPAVLGPLKMDQLLALVVLGIALLGLFERRRAPYQRPIEKRVDVEARLA